MKSERVMATYTILVEQAKDGLSKAEVERKIKSVLLRSEMSSKPFTTASSDEGRIYEVPGICVFNFFNIDLDFD